MADEQSEQSTPEPQEKKAPTSGNLPLLLGILVVLLLAGGGYLGWQMWQQGQQQESASPTPSPAAPSEPATPPPSPPPAAPPSVPSAALRENIEAAINTMNTAALEGYMTDPITVVLAASEKGGPVTAAQAVTDLNYLAGATAPWGWDLSDATITSYKNGFYGQYFTDNTVVGQSANDYVVSFTVNANNKISTIFMTGSADLLVQ